MQCKAITGNDAQCKNEAREGYEYCGIHANLEVKMPVQNQYYFLVQAISSRDIPEMGIVTGRTLASKLQEFWNQGYEVHTLEKFDRVRGLDQSPEHFWVIILLQLRK